MTTLRRIHAIPLLVAGVIMLAVDSGILLAQNARHVLPIAELQADEKIPTIRQTLGYHWAAEITSHAGMERYLHALAKAAPDRTRLVRYGSSYERRGLYYLVITSPANMRRLEQIRSSNLRLADPGHTKRSEAAEIIADMPAIVWLAHSVHGNELSSTEAAMLTTYHLLADQRESTQALLEKLVVIIDPLQNPDGRTRYVNVYRETRGRFANSYPLSTEHAERWPGGRFNHYLFDMNRDWFLHSQRETRYKVRAYLHWQPHIFVDAHEMGRNSSYFFAPPTDPINPFMLPRQNDWLKEMGRNQARWFDQYGFAYTTREMFDAFYPGYGSEWPAHQGAIGILWEQAGVRGLVVDRDDETKLYYRETVLHHYISALATLEIAAGRRAELLSDFYDARARSIQLGREGAVKNFFLPLTPHPNRAVHVARALRENGINVYRVAETIKLKATDTRTGKTGKRTIRKDSFQIPVAQPAGRLARVLLDQQVEMDEEYVKRQLQRNADHLPDQIYDVTSWSLPLAFDIPCLATDQAPLAGTPWDGSTGGAEKKLATARVAYAVRPADGAMTALCRWLRQGVRVHVIDKGFAIGNQTFPRGTLLVKVPENRDSVHEQVDQARRQLDLSVTALDSGFVTEGAHFGGPHVKWVRPPEILLATDSPAFSSVGHTWYLFDQVLQYPTTRVSCANLPSVELQRFNVLILPDGRYADSNVFTEKFAGRLLQWVRDGGTLVLVQGAAVWATGEKIKLLASRRVTKTPDKSGAADSAGQSASEKKPDDEPADKQWPDSVPGAFLHATLFDQHWLTLGCPPTMSIFFRGNVVLEPLQPTSGRNVVQFVDKGPLVASGFCWPKTQKVLAGKPYLTCYSPGKGHIIAFAGDPNYRAMYPSLQRLFVNAVMLGPGQ